MSFWSLNSFLSAVSGAFISLVFFPAAKYYFTRRFNRWRVKLIIDPPLLHSRYDTLPLRVLNNSWGTLRNVTAYVTITYNKEDMVTLMGIQTYTVHTENRPLMLSWAKVVNDRNIPYMDINQKEGGDLNLIRFHHNDDGTAIQFASEQGFFHSEWKSKGRVLLQGNKDYHFEILITADNMMPKEKKYTFSGADKRITER